MTEFGQQGSDLPHVHLIGIGGAGMSAIAHILLERGYFVSGSDAAHSDNTNKLSECGAQVWIGHAAEQVAGADVVVFNTMITSDNPELQAARERDLPILHRSQMLARLMEEGQGIAIAGAHGKTTTTSMVAYVLTQAGLDPSFLVGGVVANLQTGARAGSSPYIVAEADESDGSFLNYSPRIAVITNIEADHLEHYDGDFEKLKEAYGKFAHRLPSKGLLVTCLDDPHVRELLAGVQARVCSYALEHAEADLTAQIDSISANGSHSVVYERGVRLGTLELTVPGRHNVANALAAIAVAREVGVPFATAAAALSDFRGALRRFQTVYDDPLSGITVVDDYAHHPTEIRTSISAMKADGRRLIAVFQPQRYTRTYHLFDEFTQAFGEADEVAITAIYSPVGEKPIPGVSAERLCGQISERSQVAAHYCHTLEDVVSYLQSAVRPGDLVLTMGAGDIWKASVAFADRLRAQALAKTRA